MVMDIAKRVIATEYVLRLSGSQVEVLESIQGGSWARVSLNTQEARELYEYLRGEFGCG